MPGQWMSHQIDTVDWFSDLKHPRGVEQMAAFICGKMAAKIGTPLQPCLIAEIEIPVSRLHSLPICTMVKNDL